MKTKIIYISGNEVFDVCDIRAAFEEVRGALGLDKDTVLFGVPVDSDDALASTKPQTTNTEINTPEDTEIPASIAVTEIIETPIESEPDIEISTEISSNQDAPIDTPEFENKSEIEPTDGGITEPATDVDEPQTDSVADDESVADATPVVPILSILAGGAAVTDDDTVTTTPDVAIEPVVEIAVEVTSEPTPAPSQDEIDDVDNMDTDTKQTPDFIDEDIIPNTIVETITTEETVVIAPIDDDVAEVLITNDVPEVHKEKTLEDLFEKVGPLREDDEIDDISDIAEDGPEFTDDIDVIDPDSTDATLEQLAAEFAENQDKIPTPPPAQKQGRLGKFKNVLPFKKMKRDDSGLMGDLFGWAGIAANDDAFAMPDFFPTAAKK